MANTGNCVHTKSHMTAQNPLPLHEERRGEKNKAWCLGVEGEEEKNRAKEIKRKEKQWEKEGSWSYVTNGTDKEQLGHPITVGSHSEATISTSSSSQPHLHGSCPPHQFAFFFLRGIWMQHHFYSYFCPPCFLHWCWLEFDPKFSSDWTLFPGFVTLVSISTNARQVPAVFHSVVGSLPKCYEGNTFPACEQALH